jgi:hypothetical protein
MRNMKNKKTIPATLLMGWIFLLGGTAIQAQQHEHPQTSGPAGSAAQPSQEMEHIYCPTMKTGQLCSHGTAATLQLQGHDADAWMTLARKYNRAVDAATMQLFRDAEGVLSPEQMSQLKAWFAIGLNPQINELLYAKGLGQPVSPAAGATSTPASAMPARSMDEK